MMKRLGIGVVGFFLFIGVLHASSFEAGAVFLLIYPGAKATSLGGAFCAVADDATALYYNPSAIAYKKDFEITLIHSPWLRGLAPDMYYEFIGITRPLPVGVAGLSITYATYGLFEGQGPNGEYYGEWRPYDVAANLVYSYKVNQRLSAGGNVKFIYSFLAPAEILRKATGVEGGGQGASFAVGGSLFYTVFESKKVYSKTRWLHLKLTYGLTLDNFGPGLKYSSTTDERDPLPYLIRNGLALKINTPYHSFTLTADVNKILVGIIRDYKEEGIGYVLRDAWGHAGFEYTFYDLVSVRVGYFEDKEGAREGFTYGAGFHVGNFRLDVSDDSKIYSFDNGGANLRYALTYSMPLGGKKEVRKDEKGKK